MHDDEGTKCFYNMKFDNLNLLKVWNLALMVIYKMISHLQWLIHTQKRPMKKTIAYQIYFTTKISCGNKKLILYQSTPALLWSNDRANLSSLDLYFIEYRITGMWNTWSCEVFLQAIKTPDKHSHITAENKHVCWF